MDQELIDRIKEDVRYEFARTGPPEGFPINLYWPIDNAASCTCTSRSTA